MCHACAGPPWRSRAKLAVALLAAGAGSLTVLHVPLEQVPTSLIAILTMHHISRGSQGVGLPGLPACTGALGWWSRQRRANRVPVQVLNGAIAAALFNLMEQLGGAGSVE